VQSAKEVTVFAGDEDASVVGWLSFARLREAERNGVHVEMDNDPDV
jgi:hypothetical protein